MPGRSTRGSLLALAALAIALRLVFCWYVHPRYLASLTTVGETYFFDSYREIAANVLSGRGYVLDSGRAAIHRPPGYVAVLMASAPQTPSISRYLFQTWNALLGGLAVVATFLLARRAGVGERWAIAAGAAVAFWPFTIWETKVTVPENLLVLLMPLAAIALLRAREEHGIAIAVLAGALAGGIALTHATYQVLAAVVPFLIWSGRRDRRLAAAMLCLAGFAAVTVPWVVRNRTVAGYTGVAAGFGFHYFKGVYAFDQLRSGRTYFRDHDVPSGEAVSSMLARAGLGPISSDDARSDPARNRYLDRAAVEHMLANPGYTAIKTLTKVPLAWVHQQTAKRSVLTAVMLAPFFILACLNGRRLARGAFGALALLILSMNVAAAAVFSEAIPMRYVLPLLPLLFVLAAAGVEIALTRRVPIASS